MLVWLVYPPSPMEVKICPPVHHRSYLSAAEPQTGRWERSQQLQQDPGPHVAAQPEEPQATGWAFSTSVSNPPAAPSLVPVLWAARLCKARTVIYPKCVTAYERRLSKCLLTLTHTQARRLTLSIPVFWKLSKGDVKGTLGQVRNAGCYDTRKLQPLSSYYISLLCKRQYQ